MPEISRMSKRPFARAAVIALAVVACKAETKLQDTPETLAALDTCRRDLAKKSDYVQELEQRLADLEIAAKQAREVTVTIAGNDIEITGAGPSGQAEGPAGDATDKELYQAFLDHVQRSRGAMKKCYQGALKKNPALQARTVTMQLEVRFTAAGKASRAEFQPRIDEGFDTCMRGVTQRWSLPGAPQGYTFQQPITLSPQ